MENALMINTNVYEFTFKVRGYGANPDEAFLALQDAISDDLGIVFTNLQSFEQVPKEEADEEVQEILQESIEEVLLSLPEGDA
jgi:hypothetical protein